MNPVEAAVLLILAAGLVRALTLPLPPVASRPRGQSFRETR